MDATTFPLSFSWHVGFCVIACVFFIVEYVRMKKSYQLLLAIGIPASLLIYVKPESSSLFYAMGAFELVILLGALMFSIVERRHQKQELADTTPLEDASEPAAADADQKS